MPVSPMTAILNRSIRQNTDILNIIDFVAHERFQPNLARTGHNFHCIPCKDARTWRTEFAPIPDNYNIINNDETFNQQGMSINYDLVLCHNHGVHFERANQLQKTLDIPLINIMHVLPHPGVPNEYFRQTNLIFDICDYNIFISEFNMAAWHAEPSNKNFVIHHGINTKFFKSLDIERNNHILTMANDYIGRDWALGFSLYKQVVIDNNLPAMPIGDTQGLSLPTKNLYEVLQHFQNSSIFLNTSIHSPIPMAVLEAMACECAIVSTNTCMLPDIIEHGVDGFLVSPKNPDKMKDYLLMLLNDKELTKKMGRAARKKVQQMFNLDTFVDKYNKVFYDATID